MALFRLKHWQNQGSWINGEEIKSLLAEWTLTLKETMNERGMRPSTSLFRFLGTTLSGRLVSALRILCSGCHSFHISAFFDEKQTIHCDVGLETKFLRFFSACGSWDEVPEVKDNQPCARVICRSQRRQQPSRPEDRARVHSVRSTPTPAAPGTSGRSWRGAASGNYGTFPEGKQNEGITKFLLEL